MTPTQTLDQTGFSYHVDQNNSTVINAQEIILSIEQNEASKCSERKNRNKFTCNKRLLNFNKTVSNEIDSFTETSINSCNTLISKCLKQIKDYFTPSHSA